AGCRAIAKPREDKPLIVPVPVTVVIQKINPCVLELCRFFQQCLCNVGKRGQPRGNALRYCTDYYSWYLAQTFDICRTTKHFGRLRSLRQKCLTQICKS
uniref:Uncharacterized protein n=1 Tax=Callorhinchus milii TaxID=7868 RepID=A0A4W3JDY7_CALMI